jgi:hypothetical protein
LNVYTTRLSPDYSGADNPLARAVFLSIFFIFHFYFILPSFGILHQFLFSLVLISFSFSSLFDFFSLFLCFYFSFDGGHSNTEESEMGPGITELGHSA